MRGSNVSSVPARHIVYISYNVAADEVRRRIGTIDPVIKISKILSVPDQPLPPLSAWNSDRVPQRQKIRQWSESEDLRLLAGIHRFGLGSWELISQFVGNSRTKAQCSQRWLRGLDTNIAKRPWTTEEDTKLLELVEEYGTKSWVKVAGKIVSRCDVQCRYRYTQLTKKEERDSQSKDPKKIKLPSVEIFLREANNKTYVRV